MSEETNAPILSDTRISLAHPFQEGLIGVGILVGFLALVTGVAWILGAEGTIHQAWVYLTMANLAFWSMILAIVWLWGARKLSQIRDFLHSDRPLIRWQYTPDEWHGLKTARFRESLTGMALPSGCLGAIFAFIGLVVGAAVGSDEGLSEAVIGGIGGLVFGGLGGALLGAVVGGGNYLAALWAYHHEQHVVVALGTREILKGREYFKSNGSTRYIERARLQDSKQAADNEDYALTEHVTLYHPAVLVIELQNPKIRGASEETWIIPVPHRLVEQVGMLLPEIHLGKDGVT